MDISLKNLVLFGMLLYIGACSGDPCKKATFAAELNNTNWEGCVESFSLRNDDSYGILVQESVKRNNSPDDLFIKGFPLEKFKKVFTEENIDSFPTVSFDVVTFDSVEDTYKPTPDGMSWIEIESIDPETMDIVMRFELTLIVSRPGGPINTTYGETIVINNGLIKANPCN